MSPFDAQPLEVMQVCTFRSFADRVISVGKSRPSGPTSERVRASENVLDQMPHMLT